MLGVKTKKLIVGIGVLLFAVGIYVIAWPPHGFRKINYVGMTRDQVVAECASHDRFLDGQIMIEVGPVFHYFKTVEEIRNDAQIMSAPQWGINFKRGFIRTHYFVVHFEKDVVSKQSKSWYGDL
jgi:hypothetical protein